MVDLGKRQKIQTVSAGFSQDIQSWIFLPNEVSFAVSIDGVNFQSLGKVKNAFPDDAWGAFKKDFTVDANGQAARFIKVKATNYGLCPDWHPGAGGQTWLFMDEITIK